MCLINNHVVTNNTGIPVASPVAGMECDCGLTVLVATGGTPALVSQLTPTGRLVGR